MHVQRVTEGSHSVLAGKRRVQLQGQLLAARAVLGAAACALCAHSSATAHHPSSCACTRVHADTPSAGPDLNKKKKQPCKQQQKIPFKRSDSSTGGLQCTAVCREKWMADGRRSCGTWLMPRIRDGPGPSLGTGSVFSLELCFGSVPPSRKQPIPTQLQQAGEIPTCRGNKTASFENKYLSTQSLFWTRHKQAPRTEADVRVTQCTLFKRAGLYKRVNNQPRHPL